MTLDAHRLRCFLAVADERHFARAAELLNMTPPPLSRQIKQLERELGGELFVRGYHHVELTPFGSALVEPVREALRSIDAVADLADSIQARGTPLRVGATPHAPRLLLTEFLDAIQKSGMEVDDEVVLEQGSLDLADRVAAGTLDMALVYLPCPVDSLASVPLYEYGLVLAVRSDDELAGRPHVTVADLHGRRIVHPLSKLHPRLLDMNLRFFREAGVDVVLESGGPSGPAEVATKVWSQGLATLIPSMPGTVLNQVLSPPEFVTIPFEGPSPTMTLGAVWRPGPAAGLAGVDIALRHLQALQRPSEQQTVR